MGEVLYINNNTALRLAVYKGMMDYKNVRAFRHECSSESVNVKDPVIDLDRGVVTHGIIEEDLNALGRDRKEIVARNLGSYIYATHVTFLKDNDMTRYSRSWLLLGLPVLVIDAEGLIAPGDGSVISVEEWNRLDERQRLEVLRRRGLEGDKAQAALEYLQSSRLTGVHLNPPPHCNRRPWGIVIVAKLFAAFPLTDKTLETMMGKKMSVQGFTKPTARLLSAGRVLRAFAAAPARRVW